jgi:hypothetical protein
MIPFQLFISFWDISTASNKKDRKHPHVQTAVDRRPTDSCYFADSRGGLRHPRKLFDLAAGRTHPARARTEQQLKLQCDGVLAALDYALAVSSVIAALPPSRMPSRRRSGRAGGA